MGIKRRSHTPAPTDCIFVFRCQVKHRPSQMHRLQALLYRLRNAGNPHPEERRCMKKVAEYAKGALHSEKLSLGSRQYGLEARRAGESRPVTGHKQRRSSTRPLCLCLANQHHIVFSRRVVFCRRKSPNRLPAPVSADPDPSLAACRIQGWNFPH